MVMDALLFRQQAFFLSSGNSRVKAEPLAQYAFHLDLPIVGVYDGLHITQTKSKSFYIMDITGMGAVKLLEDAAHRFFSHTNTIVFHTDH